MNEHEEAKVLVPWARANSDSVILIRVPNHSTSARNWSRQMAEGASPGFPDYVLLLRGVGPLAWELKTVGKKPRANQLRWLERFDEHDYATGWGTAAKAIALAERLLR